MADYINKTTELIIRRELRRNMTYAEQILWRHLRNRGIGYKFKRQVSIGKYVVDFYCPKYKLAIEIDGDSHYETKAIKHDQVRSEWINKLGINIIRFTNKDIYESIDGVIEKIIKQLSVSSPIIKRGK